MRPGGEIGRALQDLARREMRPEDDHLPVGAFRVYIDYEIRTTRRPAGAPGGYPDERPAFARHPEKLIPIPLRDGNARNR